MVLVGDLDLCRTTFRTICGVFNIRGIGVLRTPPNMIQYISILHHGLGWVVFSIREMRLRGGLVSTLKSEEIDLVNYDTPNHPMCVPRIPYSRLQKDTVEQLAA